MDANFSDPLTDSYNGYNSVKETRRRNLRLSHVLYGYHDYNPVTVPTLVPAATKVNDIDVLKWTSDSVIGYTEKPPEANSNICDPPPVLSPSARNINLTNLIHGYLNYDCGISAVQQIPSVIQAETSEMSTPNDIEKLERSELDDFEPSLSHEPSQHDNTHAASASENSSCESDKEKSASDKTAEEELTIILSTSSTS